MFPSNLSSVAGKFPAASNPPYEYRMAALHLHACKLLQRSIILAAIKGEKQ
jgi:hypothetical protein